MEGEKLFKNVRGENKKKKQKKRELKGRELISERLA